MTIKNGLLLLRSVLYLSEVAKNGTLSKTAEVHGIKVSNLSKILSDLEQQLQTKLLIRKQSGVELTQDGATLVSCANSVEDALERLYKVKEKKIKEVKIFSKKEINIDLSQIKVNAKIITTENVDECDIALSDEKFICEKNFKSIPLRIEQGVICTKVFLFYRDDAVNEYICKKIIDHHQNAKLL